MAGGIGSYRKGFGGSSILNVPRKKERISLEEIQLSNELEGIVSSIIYQNEENGYTILRLDVKNEEMTVVGTMPDVSPGECLHLRGRWVRHATYGQQFKAEVVERRMPEGSKEIYHYLASGAVKGIGKATARLLMDAFGEEVLTVIELQPERLEIIRGISPKRARQISESFRQQMGMRRLMEFLSQHKLPLELGVVLRRVYGDVALEVLKSDPYILAEREFGVEFSVVDALALELGIGAEDPMRLEAGLRFELSYNLNNGHTFLPRRKLIDASGALLSCSLERLDEALDRLERRGEVERETVAGQDAIYLPELYEAELAVSHRVGEMSREELLPPGGLEHLLERIQQQQGISYAPQQREAVELAAKRQIMLLTGGPGTGKTTVIKAILSLFDALKIDTALAAPTGRAAKRMSLATGREAKTLHRLLEADYGVENKMHFQKDENSPLDFNAIIVDEMSMTDILLLSALLRAIKPGTKLILIGDSDQLPPVGAGDCLRDILNSGAFGFVKLDVIFRQSEKSLIVDNAHKINNGEMPILSAKEKDFSFMPRTTAYDTASLCANLCENRLPKAYGYEPLNDIQVISPTRKGESGTVQLNKLLQSVLNPPDSRKKEKIVKDIIFREGDKIMQIRNNYMQPWKDKHGFSGEGIYNGDIGIITEIDIRNETFTVVFDDKISDYEFAQVEEIEHAFAVTVHKSQGSEYPCVIIPIIEAPNGLLTRNMLYTAVTRAQQMVIIAGKENVIQTMVSNNKQIKRYTGLCRMLKSFSKKSKE